MMLQITFNHFISHLTCRCTKISSRPKVSAPIAFFDDRKLFKQLTSTSAFEATHDLTWGHAWRSGEKQMDMIFTHHPTENSDLKCFASLTDQFTNSQGHITSENLITIFGNPNKMILNIEKVVSPFEISPRN